MTSELDTLRDEETPFDTRNQVRLHLSRSTHKMLAGAKDILHSRGLEDVSIEDLLRACLEEHQPLDLASIYLEHRLKQRGGSICDY